MTTFNFSALTSAIASGEVQTVDNFIRQTNTPINTLVDAEDSSF